jgi:TolA-binding protein
MLSVVLAGCGQDQYAIEREYYSIQKQAAAVMTNPDATPPAELQIVITALERFAAKYPQAAVAVDAKFSIAKVYTAKKYYSKAQDELKQIGKDFIKSEPVCAEALFMRGAVYEDEGDWPSALAQYEFLIQVYPKSLRGIEAPMRIALWYKNKFQMDNMMQAWRQAITHYKALSKQYPVTPMDFQLRLLIARSYAELQEWENAAQTLETARADFKDKARIDAILLNLASIYHTQLKDVAKARTVLEQVIKDYPTTRSSDMAKGMLVQLNKESK